LYRRGGKRGGHTERGEGANITKRHHYKRRGQNTKRSASKKKSFFHFDGGEEGETAEEGHAEEGKEEGLHLIENQTKALSLPGREE